MQSIGQCNEIRDLCIEIRYDQIQSFLFMNGFQMVEKDLLTRSRVGDLIGLVTNTFNIDPGLEILIG